MNGLELNCFYHSDTTSALKGLDIEYSLSDCDVRPIVFYDINAISSYIDKDIEYGCIHANGSEFTTVLSFFELKQKIEQWQ